MKSSQPRTSKPSPQSSYLSILKQYQWPTLIAFTTILTISGFIAYRLAPPPGYIAQGILTANTPPIKFSTIGGAILKQGEKLTRSDLLADNVIEAVTNATQIQPEQIRQHTKINFSPPEKPLEIAVQYQANDRQQALATTEVLLKAMIEKSRLINFDRWQIIRASLDQRLQQISKDLQQAEQDYNQSSGNAQDLARLEQQVKFQQELYDKTQTALTDAKAAQPEIISSLALNQAPEIIAYPGSNWIVPLTLGAGLLVGLFVSGGLIPLGAIWKQKAARNREERERLQAILYQLIGENNGQITLIQFAMKAQLPADTAQRYLNQQAEAFNATCEVKPEGSIVYTFRL